MRRSREAELVRYRSQHGLLDIDGMDSSTFKLTFRFHKNDFDDFCSALLVPREITSAQNVRLCGREALCMLLRRLAYPNMWCDLEAIFGRHSSVMSSATSRLMDHIWSTFGHLLTDVNNHEWMSLASLKEFAGAVEDKGSPLPNCWAFIDGTARPICRPKRNQKLYFSGHKRMHMRLMGRQTRTLLPVPASHLVPETVPNRAVHNRLQEIRQRQRIYYNRRSRNLPPLSTDQRATTYDTHERTWTPAVFLRPAETPRSVVVKTEEGQEIRRTREHLRDAPTHTKESPRDGQERLDDAQPAQELRRSTRTRREPCRYPQPERAARYGIIVAKRLQTMTGWGEDDSFFCYVHLALDAQRNRGTHRGVFVWKVTYVYLIS
ncbi:hypothetical protein HPB52_009905 [Rhipicephalus sanguineus]|uniref:Uncharacterized protein n=1 Tax=Rhipicephalus sanguineus TaxID=34632 RepID=A0A9D4PDE8_RHISA|nr:hypothetical protein HPB52_009905 [Rhipicephalus sanguineus]